MYKDLESLSRTIVQSEGLVMIIGSTDSGKTTIAKYLLSRLCLLHSCIGFIDSDVGQSTIGPPGTISATTFSQFDPEKNWEQQAQNINLFFLGNFSPMGHILELILAIKKMIDYLQQLGSKIILIDTTGLVKGRIGLYLKKSKIEFLQPKHIILVQNGELETLIKINAHSSFHVLPISQKVKKRSIEQRSHYRENKLKEYFAGSSLKNIPFPPVIQWRKDLITSSFLSPSELVQLSSIVKQRIHCAAISHRTLIIASDAWFYCNLVDEIKNIFFADSIYIISKPHLISKYISIEDPDYQVLTLGVVKNIDFQNRNFTIFSPHVDFKKIYCIKFGSVKIYL